MNNLRLGYNNVIDNCDLTATVSNYLFLPVSNLKSLSRTELFRCSANQEIKGNMAAISAVGMVALWRHTLTGTWSLYLYSGSNQTGSVVYSQTGITEDVVWFTAVIALSFKLVFSNGQAFDLSRVFIGEYYQPTFNMDYNAALLFNDVTEQSRTMGGSMHFVSGATYRSFDFDLSLLPVADRNSLATIFKSNGRRKDLFFSGFPDDTTGLRADHEMLAVVKNQPGYSSVYTLIASSKIQLEEC